MATTDLKYVIDEQDRLVRVNQAYFRFASENGWAGADASVGRPLWDFVCGHQLKTLLRLLVRRIRGTGSPVDLAFRCDGPDLRRELDIHIAPTPSGRAVVFETRVRSEEPREFQPLLDPTADRSEESIEMCGWCDRFLVEDEWVEVEQAATRMRLFQSSVPPEISHGICPGCAEKLFDA